MEIDEKSKDVPNLTKASYRVSIDPSLLKRMVYLGRFDDIAPSISEKYLTEAHINKLIEGLWQNLDEGFGSKLIDDALCKLSINMSISDPQACVFQLSHSVFERLSSIGYEKFREN